MHWAADFRTATRRLRFGTMRDRETIDAELRLLAAIRRVCREHSGKVASMTLVDALLDERSSGRHQPRQGSNEDHSGLMRVPIVEDVAMPSNMEAEKDQLIEAALALPGVAEITEVYQAASTRAGLPTAPDSVFSFATSANANETVR